MNKKVSWFNSLLRDERGDISSKRIIGILSSLILFIIAIRLAFTIENDTIPDSLINALTMIATVGLGLTTVDKFIFARKGFRKSIDEKKDEDSVDYEEDSH